MQTEQRTFTPDALRQLAARVFEAAGAPADTAALVADALVDAHLAGRLAMDEAVARAKQYGVSAVGIVRTSHLGRLGAYVERAADAGCVAFAFIGGLGGQFMAAPFGGSGKLFGTNPLAAAGRR